MSSESPDVILFDINGNPIGGSDNTTNATTKIPVLAARANAVAPTWTDGYMAPLSVDTSGNLRITGSISASNPSVSTTGTTPPASATYIGGSVTTSAPSYTSGQMNALSLDGYGNLRVTGSFASSGIQDTVATGTLGALNASVSVALTGEAGFGFQLAAGTLVGTIVAETSFDGGTTWNITTFSTQGNRVNSVVFASSNTATAGGVLTPAGSGLGRIRVSAYTSGTANITLRSSQIGNTSVAYAGSQTGTLQPLDAAQIAGWDGTNLRVPAVKAASTTPAATDQALVVSLSPNSNLPVQADGYGSGTISALNGFVNIPTSGYTSLTIAITGTFSATIAFQFSADGINWVFDTVINANNGTFTTTAALPSTFQVLGIGGYKAYRVIATAYTSGTINVTYDVGVGNNVQTSQSLISDGTNGPAAVKPASTAAVAADPSLVVAVSPNSPPPTAADKAVSGTLGALNAALTISTNGCSTVTFDLTNSWSGTVVPEAQTGDGIWWAVSAWIIQVNNLSSSMTSACQGVIPCGGFTQIRLRMSTYTSGSAIASMNAGDGMNVQQTAIVSAVPFYVQGDGPSGSTPYGNPVLTAGIDGGGITRTILTNTLGQPSVDISQAESVFKHVITSGRLAQIQVFFNTLSPSSILTSTLTGTGSVAGPTNGLGSFSTGTGATGRSLGVSYSSVAYSPHEEIFAAFTASFTAGATGTYQRIGLYNTNDGFSFGYNGTTFGIWTRFNGVDTFIAQSSWNVDTLSGAATSGFTRGGTPEALIQTDINLYRVRFGWLGIAPVIFEVLSADGNFITVHVVRYPNSQTTVSITAPYLPMTVDVNNNSTGSTNLTVTSGCWVAGTSAGPLAGQIAAPIATVNLNGNVGPATTGSSVTAPVAGLGSLGIGISGTWSGTITFQFSMDGNIWYNDTVFNPNTGAYTSSTTVNGSFEAPIGAARSYRAVATAWTSGTAIIQANAGTSPTVMNTLTALTDGSNDGPVAVKPASVAALTTDPALVVSISPNSPDPVGGANSLGIITGVSSTSISGQNFLNVVDINTQNRLDTLYARLDDLVNLLTIQGIINNPKSQRSFLTSQYAYAASTTATIMLNTNANRTGATFQNDSSSTSNLYLLLGAGQTINGQVSEVSATNYTIKVTPGTYYEVPFGFSGRIDGIWNGAAGNVYVTEISNSNL